MLRHVDDRVTPSTADIADDSQLESTEFTRFVSVADDRNAAVDVVARYISSDGSVSCVSSADIYETDDNGRITTITSYAVELGS